MAEILERVYVVPLRDAWNSRYHKRTRKAVNVVRAFAERHMKVEAENVKIDKHLNNLLWARGNANPPRKIKVVMKKQDGKVYVYEYEHYEKLKQQEKERQKQAKKEQAEKKAQEQKSSEQTAKEQKEQKAEAKDESKEVKEKKASESSEKEEKKE